MAAKIKARKVKVNSNDGFSETVKFEVLMQSNVETNHNKFYCLEIQKHPSTEEYRLFSHYGRLGKTNVYDIRDNAEGASLTLEMAEKEYDTILRKKKKGKKVKDGGEVKIEKYEKIETVMPTVGSENICNKQTTTVTQKVAKLDTSGYTNPEVVRIIDQVTNENIHNITTKTSLVLTSSGFETPLGPVTKEHVDRAREPLDELKANLKDGKINSENKNVREANNMYYSLIPHTFGHKITIDDWILDDVKLLEEYDLLEQLETAVQMGSAMGKSAKQRLDALGTEIEIVDNKNEISRIIDKTVKSRASNHRNIWQWNVKKIFKIKIPSERKRFETHVKKFGNIKELFHGSQNCNILSILKNGLIIPPCNAGHVTGRMFGDGVYAASNSTKALNYSIGFWSGRGNKFNNSFLFLTKFAMGKIYEPTQSFWGSRGLPKGYDSVHAKRQKTGLYNDEFIVYKLQQATLTHLLELKK